MITIPPNHTKTTNTTTRDYETPRHHNSNKIPDIKQHHAIKQQKSSKATTSQNELFALRHTRQP
jgi:hypothetical protein